jgi:hypothetical protein
MAADSRLDFSRCVVLIDKGAESELTKSDRRRSRRVGGVAEFFWTKLFVGRTKE